MIDKYYEFNVDKFFADYTKHKARYRELEIELENIPTDGGMDYSVPRVDGGEPSDMVFRKVSRREYIRGLMGRLKIYFDLYDAVWGILEDDEKTLVEAYWLDTKTPRKIIVSSLSKKLYVKPNAIYIRINELRRKIRDFVDADVGK